METQSDEFVNLAGAKGADDDCEAELKAAGIDVIKMEFFRRASGEVKTAIRGSIGDWKFERAWTYWTAAGPGIPHVVATKLHKKFGKEVRVAGHCGCPSPMEWYGKFGVGDYHIDTARGLKALADVIRQLINESDNIYIRKKK